MLSELHLKYHAETGNSKPTRQIYDGDDEEFVDIPSEDYLEWVEDLAMKQLKSVKVNTDTSKAVSKLAEIKSCFEALKSEINSIDPDDVERYEIDSIVDACDTLESVIYD